ncbi:unnamed protein product [Hermetia illucens]|uniref:BZIP domain-containing protein n=2 Tax=Hermetia illucens TaxID=343691 RepID=A0A7R8UX79_HERIL|nr:CCAAT/enhancer-binding protein [Hermetia illucens]CAD7088693.1 unnamed protein product [Hermetia illucens]
MESPQMYDTVQTLSQLDIKKDLVGQQNNLTMANNNNNSSVTANNNNNPSAVNNNNNSAAASLHHNPLVVKQQQTTHHMQQAAAVNNNNNNNTANNNSILQKHMLQQYTQNDLDELTAQEITLDLQHLIDDQFREQEALGIFADMVPSQSTNSPLQTNGAVSAAAKVLQLQQQQHQQNLRQQSHGYGRNALAYMPQAVHSGATYGNNSSDENSSVNSEASTIKEEPIDPQEYRRQLAASAAGAQFLTGTTTNGNTSNGLYSLNSSSYASNGNGNTFTTLTPAGVLHHQALPHLTGAHLASLKHHQKPMLQNRKNSNKSVDKGTEEYRRRRERNNIAVRKSREKAKVRSREVEEKVKTLLKEKDVLLRRLEEMTNEIQLHKQIYMQLMNHSNPEITRICRSFLNMSEHGI